VSAKFTGLIVSSQCTPFLPNLGILPNMLSTTTPAIALANFRELCLARLAYNRQLILFLLKGDEPSVKHYCQQTLCPSIDKLQFAKVKKIMIQAVTEDTRLLYQDFLNRMASPIHTQDFLDELHYRMTSLLHHKLFQKLLVEQFMQQHKASTTSTAPSFHSVELVFIEQLLNQLASSISQRQKDFAAEHDHPVVDGVVRLAPKQEKGLFRLTDCHQFFTNLIETAEKCVGLLQRCHQEIAFDLDIARFIQDYQLISYFEAQLTQTGTTFIYTWSVYNEIHALHAALKHATEQLQIFHDRLITQASTTKTNAHVSKNQQTIKALQKLKAAQAPCFERSESFQQAAAALREQREANKPTLTEKPDLSSDPRIDDQALISLTPANQELLQKLLAQPLPPPIGYGELLSLFGKEPGQLPGEITTIKGVHKKLSLFGITGYFDEIYPNSLVQTTSSTPQFEQDKKKHSAKVPYSTLGMVRVVLERLGVNSQRLENTLHSNKKQGKVLTF